MAEDNTFSLSIDGKTYTVDPDDLELGEIELIEEEMDAAIEHVDFSRAKAMRLLAYTLVHRENAKFTMDDAKHLKMSAFAEVDDKADDKPAANGRAKGPTRAAKAAG